MIRTETAPDRTLSGVLSLLVIALPFVLVPLARGQAVSALVGLVTDPSGASISYARIHLTEENSEASQSAGRRWTAR